MKKIILATAVASIMAGSMAQVAQAETTMYGKARIFLELATETNATPSVKDKGVSSYSSRIGWKGSEDLGNGMSAVYQFELGFNADGDNGTNKDSAGHTTGDTSPFDTRVGYAGIKGDFGQVAIGQQWTPSYVLVRGKHDPMNTTAGGKVYAGNFPRATRVDDAISYIGAFGDIKVAIATVASNGGSGSDVDADSLNDHTDAAISIPAGPVTIGVAMANSNPTSPATSSSPVAVNIGWADGAISLDVGFFMIDKDDVVGTAADEGADMMSIVGKFKTGSGTIVAQLEDDGNETQTNLAYNHNLSKKTSLMAELSTGDSQQDEMNVGIHINF